VATKAYLAFFTGFFAALFVVFFETGFLAAAIVGPPFLSKHLSRKDHTMEKTQLLVGNFKFYTTRIPL